jgi:hypothetical protein
MTEPSEAERTVLHAFIRAMTDVTNTCRTEVPLEVLADAMLSGAAEILRKLHGAPIAAERIRQVAAEIERRYPEPKH